MAFIYTDNAATVVTRVGPVENLRFDKNNVGFNEEVTLSWDAAEDGICNPVKRYDIYERVKGDDYFIASTTDTWLAIDSPPANATYSYVVDAVGKIESLSSKRNGPADLVVFVGKPSTPTGLTLSQSEAAPSAEVTLTWNRSADGTNNAVNGYEIYLNGAFYGFSVEPECVVWAPPNANEVDRYTVKARGSATTDGSFDSDLSDAVELRVYASQYTDVYYTYNANNPVQTFIVPTWAKRVDVCCIGGGAGGAIGGVTYNGAGDAPYGDYKVYPAGGAGGATGRIISKTYVDAAPGKEYEIVVGAGGGVGLSGGTSSFGALVSALGGGAGWAGGNEPLNPNATANGGRGGDGGIGGDGGGTGKGAYSTTVGTDGDDGTSYHSDWESWPVASWYVFNDQNTGRRLGISGRGGYGYDLQDTKRVGNGASLSVAPGTTYGGGGNGGDQQRTGWREPTAGQPGLVAVRCWRYLS